MRTADCQPPFLLTREFAKQALRGKQSERGVAEELEPLVVPGGGKVHPVRRRRERLSEKSSVPERVSYRCLEVFHFAYARFS